MTIKEATHLIKTSIGNIHEAREINAITEWILEDLTGLKRVDRLMADITLNEAQTQILQQYATQLKKATPIQYITGYAWFMGQKIWVDENVLIPRPETEELVSWAIEKAKPRMKMIDIGTGSGCIPVLFKHLVPEAEVYGIDVSGNALAVAQKNAAAFGATISFLQLDILDQHNWAKIPKVDMILSNPPYIPLMDKDSMDQHVVEHEPHLALFVPDNDPLVFYKAILELAETKLVAGGQLFFETHYALAHEVAALTLWPAEIREDAYGKQRMVQITKP